MAEDWRRALLEDLKVMEVQFDSERLLQAVAPETTFRDWVEHQAQERVDPVTRETRPGLLIDGKPFSLENRPALAWVYDQAPTTPKECFQHMVVMMKCAQVGFTVMEILLAIYLGLKFGPATIGMFLPDMNLTGVKSTERFMPIVRSMPEVYALMTQGEGNVTRRRLGKALFVFSWTSGKATTESIPMDFLSFDEVQEMTLPQMEKTMERLSASQYRFTLMGSTANWPELDIHHWYKQGTQHRFHTECPTCGLRRPLDDYFPECIRWDAEKLNPLTKRPGSHRYVCPNGHWIDDSQRGQWIADNPEAWVTSLHFHQMLSPDISPDEIMRKFRTSTDKKNFYNRVLGKPYLDPTQIPVTLEHMRNCVAEGRKAGVVWKTRAKHTYMGIDQMGGFNVAIIKERMPDGRQAVVHAEMIWAMRPFDRCDELMRDYGVDVCVVEINPNYNDAKAFANRHRGRVFICDSFGEIKDDMLQWGDAPSEGISERRTDEEEQDRYTVRIDQFKCMQRSFARFTAPTPHCLWPDDQALVQEVKGKDERMQREPVAPIAFHHFTKTALVVESVKVDGEKEATTNKVRRRVRKVGVDPHFSYANLLCDVAWARAHGTMMFMLPPENTQNDERREKAAVELEAPGLPARVVSWMEKAPPGRVCGRCEFYPFDAGGPPDSAACYLHKFTTRAKDPGCLDFEVIEALAKEVAEEAPN